MGGDAAAFVRLANESQSQRAQNERLPIVIWHGMGDSCCSPFSIGSVQRYLEAPGAHMHFSFPWFQQEVVDKYLT